MRNRSAVPSLPQPITFSPQYARWLQAPAGVPLKHDLLGRIERVEENLGEEGVPLADLELPSGAVEEPLLEPLRGDPQGRLPAGDRVIGTADELPGAIALGRSALGYGVVDPDVVASLDDLALAGVCRRVVSRNGLGHRGGDGLTDRGNLRVGFAQGCLLLGRRAP